MKKIFIKMTVIMAGVSMVAGCGTVLTGRSPTATAERRLLRIHEAGEKSRAFTAVCTRELDALLAEQKFAEAKNLFWKVMQEDPDASFAMLGRIEHSLFSNERYDELVRWCERLLTWCIYNNEIKDEVVYPLMGYMIEALDRMGRHDAIIGTLQGYGDYLSLLKREEMITRVFERFVRDGRYAEAREVIEMSVGNVDRFNQMVEYMRIYLACAEGKLHVAEDIITNNVTRFSDDYLIRGVKVILPKAMSLTSTGMVENICELIVEKKSGKKKIMDIIAGYWVDIARKKGDRALLVSRLSRLLESGTSTGTVEELYCRHASFVLQTEKENQLLQKMFDIGERLLAVPCADRHDIPELELRMMDCCFLLEQYDRAKEIFDLCKSQLSQEEVEVLENKILAHVAMKAGNYEEALTRFKVFTETLRKKKRDEYDHIHGETVPYEALMGLNMKRIGELFALKGDSASAVKAYEEAKTYYQQAAGKVEKNGYWCMRIDEDLKVLEQKISQAKK